MVYSSKILNVQNHYVGVQYFEPLQQDHLAFNILKFTLTLTPGIELPRLSKRGLIGILSWVGTKASPLLGDLGVNHDFYLQPRGCFTCFQNRL